MVRSVLVPKMAQHTLVSLSLPASKHRMIDFLFCCRRSHYYTCFRIFCYLHVKINNTVDLRVNKNPSPTGWGADLFFTLHSQFYGTPPIRHPIPLIHFLCFGLRNRLLDDVAHLRNKQKFILHFFCTLNKLIYLQACGATSQIATLLFFADVSHGTIVFPLISIVELRVLLVDSLGSIPLQ